jgi:hypothetical protein
MIFRTLHLFNFLLTRAHGNIYVLLRVLQNPVAALRVWFDILTNLNFAAKYFTLCCGFFV